MLSCVSFPTCSDWHSSLNCLYIEAPSNDWSDSEDEDAFVDPNRKIQLLEKKLLAAQQNLAQYKDFVSEKLNASSLSELLSGSGASQEVPQARDDDSHYFESYSENGRTHRRQKQFILISQQTFTLS